MDTESSRWGQELVSKCPQEDDDHAELEEGEVGACFAVAAGGDAAEGFQPGDRALDRPAVAGLRVARFASALLAAPDLVAGLVSGDRLAAFARLADAGADLPLGQRLFVRGRGVAAVGQQLLGLDAGLGQGVEQRQQVALLVLVAGREQDRQRQAAAFDR